MKRGVEFWREFGPFDEQGWFEIEPGMFSPGRPAIQALIEYNKSKSIQINDLLKEELKNILNKDESFFIKSN